MTNTLQVNKIRLLTSNFNKFDSKKPILSIVIPALNEEITIGEFIDWCWIGIEKSKIDAEILIIDSSTDETSKIALEKGARVLKTPKRGLGQAYIDAIPYIRGEFIIMGDCDLTYDFREINFFTEKFKDGFEFIMGSRFLGSIEKDAMPNLHRYFGNPLTTFILNKIYKSTFTDIHCGMRGLTKNALIKINLSSSGWEYASEMVLKAVRCNLKVTEVPVKFYKDREGRLSHLKRNGFWTPWYAGWINLRVMLIYSPDSFILKPGFFFIFLGLLLVILSSFGEVKIGQFGFKDNSYFLGIFLLIFGYTFILTALVARKIHNYRNKSFLEKFFDYNSGMIISAMLALVGLLLEIKFVNSFFGMNANTNAISVSKTAITGLFLMMLGFQTFCFTLMMDLLCRTNKKVV
jgi:glycosyltransferase involved in cell wall biosynthesis